MRVQWTESRIETSSFSDEKISYSSIHRKEKIRKTIETKAAFSEIKNVVKAVEGWIFSDHANHSQSKDKFVLRILVIFSYKIDCSKLIKKDKIDCNKFIRLQNDFVTELEISSLINNRDKMHPTENPKERDILECVNPNEIFNPQNMRPHRLVADEPPPETVIHGARGWI